PLAQLRLLPGPAVDADLEQFGLAQDQTFDVRLADAARQLRRKGELVQSALFGLQPCRACPLRIEILGDDGKARLRDGVVKPHQNVTGLDDIAVARQQLADDAAGRVLHLLHVGLDYDLTRCDQRARDLRGRRPAAEPAGKDHDHGEADDQMQPDRLTRALFLAGEVDHDLVTPPSETILIGEGGATRCCSTCASTCSLGPKACARPSRSTRIWSTASMPIGRCATTTTMAPRSRAPRMARDNASSPSVSRLEFGSSSTIRNGSPYSARASATRWAWPAESAAPCSPIWVL